MENEKHHQEIDKASLLGMLVTIGIVYGDIGTSPLYTFPATIKENIVSELLVLGAFSCIFWTLTFQTTLKYVIITLNADNKGEGGIFSLYTLIRRASPKWMLYPAIVGGSFLLADGIITPPISVSSAIEGLRVYSPELHTVPIVIVILVLLFIAQQFGTEFLGRFFGPIMVIWFTFIGVIGAIALSQNFLPVLYALNPIYVYRFLAEYPGGFWLLGGVFLCTTGAEALYSDMGHVGRANIRYSWIYVKIMLLLSYAGQASYLLSQSGNHLNPNRSPFYSIVPDSILPLGILIATLATIIASQALITGSFTLIGEAMRLNFWSRQKIYYPTDFKGQLYIPQVNWLLMFGCIGVVLYFQESKYMEAAFGLAVTLTMMMSTVLIAAWLYERKVPVFVVVGLTGLFLIIETSFLIANIIKFEEGGWISIVIGAVLISVMWLWQKSREYRSKFTYFENTETFFHTLRELSNDTSLPQYATHLVYLTASETINELENQTMLSILQKTPKRADVYWFVNIKTDDEPFTMKYRVENIVKDDVYYVQFTLGFRIEPRVNYFFELVLEELEKNKEVNATSRHPVLEKYNVPGDLRFVLTRSFLSYENDLSFSENFVLRSYYLLRRFSISEDEAFGLDASNVEVENVPIVVTAPKNVNLVREKFENVSK
ncbi:MAG: KUP/HAK/KT family potassium transporter [Pyrinomonadaceae bacterium]|nr:KUP/HAK/KT family potassium transporter [Pyrinomonadaceae bacterium]